MCIRDSYSGVLSGGGISGVKLSTGGYSQGSVVEGLVRYQVSKTNGGPSYHEWPAAEFVGRVAALVPHPRKHMVRYYGALGPRSPLRAAVTAATRERATNAELERGYSVTPAAKVTREARPVSYTHLDVYKRQEAGVP